MGVLMLRIDKEKIRHQMNEQGIGSLNQLGEKIQALPDEWRISERTVYNSLDTHNWGSKTLHALALVLKCSPTELLTLDIVDPPVM